jgi:hypothetical protein
MPDNKSKKIKFANNDGAVYTIIFLLYLTALIISFAYSLKFLTANLNMTFDPVAPQSIDNKYANLNLKSYAIVAKKLGLKLLANTNHQEENTQTASTTNLNLTETINNNISTNSPLSQLEVTSTNEINNQSSPLKISIINSTTKTGLANELKKQFIAAGYQIENTGNQVKAAPYTKLMVRPEIDVNSPTLIDIKNIVSTKYNFVIATSSESSLYDVEIIIGKQ